MFRELLARIAHSLDKNKVSYMVIGGQAVLVYGHPRMTQDIDITLGVDASRLEVILKIAEEAGLKGLPANPEEFVRKTNVLPVVDEKSNIRVDYIFSFSEFEKTALTRVNKVEMDGVQVSFASLEDLIVHKMVAGRPRDIEDIRSLLLKNPSFDQAYVLKWLKAFDITLSRSLTPAFRKLMHDARK